MLGVPLSGGHNRLGSGSLVSVLQDEILSTICTAASHYVVSNSVLADFSDINSTMPSTANTLAMHDLPRVFPFLPFLLLGLLCFDGFAF